MSRRSSLSRATKMRTARQRCGADLRHAPGSTLKDAMPGSRSHCAICNAQEENEEEIEYLDDVDFAESDEDIEDAAFGSGSDASEGGLMLSDAWTELHAEGPMHSACSSTHCFHGIRHGPVCCAVQGRSLRTRRQPAAGGPASAACQDSSLAAGPASARGGRAPWSLSLRRSGRTCRQCDEVEPAVV